MRTGKAYNSLSNVLRCRDKRQEHIELIDETMKMIITNLAVTLNPGKYSIIILLLVIQTILLQIFIPF